MVNNRRFGVISFALFATVAAMIILDDPAQLQAGQSVFAETYESVVPVQTTVRYRVRTPRRVAIVPQSSVMAVSAAPVTSVQAYVAAPALTMQTAPAITIDEPAVNYQAAPVYAAPTYSARVYSSPVFASVPIVRARIPRTVIRATPVVTVNAAAAGGCQCGCGSPTCNCGR